MVCLLPQATFTTLKLTSLSPSKSTTRGVATIDADVSDKPSWPQSFQPQTYKSPLSLIAQECQPPAEISLILIPAKASIRAGSSKLSRVPYPSCPRL